MRKYGEQAAEDNEAAMGLDDATTKFLDLIEQRADERARQLLADWQRNGAPASGHDAAAEATEEAEPG
jgi:glycine/serine hydroxymethyltransferase